MVISIYKNPTEKYQIPKNIIIDNCIVSDIVHYNFPLNPVSEISNLFQCTLVGPNGFKKNNVPMYLRNLDDTQFGKICPADTPDRDGCGVILNLVPTVEIDEYGKFIDSDNEIITSHAISLTPFLENDDQTRLQMASGQTKQTILIKESEKPMVKSGIENMCLDRTTFLSLAKDDGEIVYRDDKFIIASYDDKTNEAIEINYRSMYLNTMDFIECKLNKGDRFKKGQILASSSFLKDGELSLGKNLLTAIMIYKGYNYEDGIVISESIASQMTSLHYVDLTFDILPGQVLLSLDPDNYIPIPVVGQKLNTGDVYAKVKILDPEDGYENINEEPLEKIAPIECTVVGIEIFPNTFNKKVPEFNLFI
jgi:DNA-directed RNA polymerase beta subunit